MDSSMEMSDGGSSDFAPKKPKARAAPKKPAATKAKAAPKKLTQTTLKPKKINQKASASKNSTMVDHEDVLGPRSDLNPDEDEDAMSSTPPNAAKPKKSAVVAKKAATKPLANIENESFADEGAAADASDRFQMLTHLEHIIKRPDTYIGSVEQTDKQMWVYNSTTELMEFRDVSYVPGLYKIFDEILVNAADNKQNDKNMSEIRVTIDRETEEISVWNNGRGIPVEIHKQHQIYIPHLIFGHLLTSSNYNDNQAKVTGGRNGFGAKLCNIFSTQFTIETADSNTKKKFKLTWTDNMTQIGKPKITDFKGDDFTKVTFKPDFKRFGMDGMDDDFEALVKRRVYDLAGTSKTTVKLNGTKVPVRNFKKYMEMYTKAIKSERGEEAATDKAEIITESPNPRWEIGFAVSDGSFQQVSFVNSVATTSGGTHVNYISDQICTKLAESIKKKNKTGATLKAAQIKNHIFLFVNCLIENPAFTSQTKEQLTTKSTSFGSKCNLSDDFLKKIMKTQVMDNILHFAEKKADQLLKKSDGNRRSRINNPKLVDANKAGTKEGHKCTLILTEGESAKGLAMAGRAIVGPDLFGVFPLRGKLLNVRDASVDQISKNAEIQNIKNFLGLQHKKEYVDTKNLRYGHLMIMTDQDHDGSHIKGLLINYLQVAYPSLLKVPGFLIEFITPIIKIWKGDPKAPTASKSFFTMPEYDAWCELHPNAKKWDKKYYKGLGTSTTEDAEIYFQDLDKHLKEFHTLQDDETRLIELAFSKKKADERKEWLRQFKPGTYLDHSVSKISYTDFINKELILFSMADNIRSIPSVVDGLKPGQRKILYTMFKRNVVKDIKVVELAGYAMGMTAYQHGDASIQQTIVGLAQTFIGSNNVNCLEPSGNFGSRLQGGSDSASPRYIYTRLSPFARKLFHPADEPLLNAQFDDGKQIEPEVYAPVVPLILINGADGIGTGWSTSIPNYNPEDIVANLNRLMDGKDMEPMNPWFRGFTGEVVASGDRYKFSGVIKQTGDFEVEITELPIRTWTQDFKDKLEDIIKGEKGPAFVKDYKDYNNHTQVHFIIQMDEKFMKNCLDEGLEEKFKLSKFISTTNLVAFDPEGRITKYNSVEEIMRAFYAVRIKLYEQRKQLLLSQLQKELDKLTNQARFIQMIIDGKLVISKKKKADLIQELKQKGFTPFPKISDAVKEGETAVVIEEANEDGSDAETGGLAADAYNYLLGLPLWSLTKERVEKLILQMSDKENEIDELIKLSKEDLWRRDLHEFIEEWRRELAGQAQRTKQIASRGRRHSAKLKTGGRAPAVKKRKADIDEDSDFGAPKPKKAVTVNHVKPKGGLLDYLGKSKVKPRTKAYVDGASDSEDSDAEIIPQKSSRVSKKDVMKAQASQPVKSKITEDDENDATISQVKRDAGPKATQTGKSAPIDLLHDLDLSDDEFLSAGQVPTTKPKIQPALPPPEEDSGSDVEIVSKPTQRRARTARKPARYHDSHSSGTDDGDDLLGDVSTMVKGIPETSGDAASDPRTLFSELSRPSSGTGTKPMIKALRVAADFDQDETDYSKLIPQHSPRRSLVIKPKETKASSDLEGDSRESIQPIKPKAAAKRPLKSAKPTAVASKGRAKKTTTSATTTSSKKAAPLSPAAKAYASKKAKANKKILDASDDEIDAMANDILGSESDKPAEAPVSRARPSRRAATTAKKPAYTFDDSDEDDFGGEAASSDDFSDID
ncbi:DNA topoisomerase 2 [Myotisia sp. PD_48]|nr:DNA topoisomerase 2 [Myotisia sp. PD_48]